MQDHRTAGLGGRSCSGEPQQPPACATAPRKLYCEQRGWKGVPRQALQGRVGVEGEGESGEGLPHRYVAAGGRARARGLPGGPVGVPQRLLLYPLEVPLRGMEANPKVKGHIGQAGCDECYSPPEERVMSDRAAPSSLCSSPLGGWCQRITGPPHGLALPCSKGFAMVTSWASCCSQENCASDHFTRSWGSWPWIRKHCGAEGEAWHPAPPPCPTHPETPLRCPRPQALGRLGGCERKT